ncbi:hypothetical protein H696_06299 [Fonticula alba]|uniref:t-SNARE coiled-coil homology domain-containing protein n=1 Tax=Fonticula alba TaxID=691883 RepID=A0A058Z157_FONAL|nr:hypothetical protein H696_06299 [Fonticula alba]KCV67277.1 hypothetical protein H696_06299 [Fonticula alba]|eukprot:XP_009498317.1 hypothetical protein H696_06299 [Fonticula alba]
MSFGDLERGDSPGGWNSNLDSQYLRLVDRVAKAISDMGSSISSIQHQAQSIGSQHDTQEFRNNLNNLVAKTTTQTANTKKLLQELSAVPSTSLSPDESRQRTLQFQKLHDAFQASVRRLNETQTMVATRMREQVKIVRTTHAMGGPSTDEFTESSALMSQQQLEQAAVLDNDITHHEESIRERQTAIEDIEANIRAVNDIFRDLNQLVQDQGETIDTIETNIVRVEENASAGRVEISQANSYQKSSRNKLCIILGIFVIVLVVLVLVAVFT